MWLRHGYSLLRVERVSTCGGALAHVAHMFDDKFIFQAHIVGGPHWNARGPRSAAESTGRTRRGKRWPTKRLRIASRAELESQRRPEHDRVARRRNLADRGERALLRGLVNEYVVSGTPSVGHDCPRPAPLSAGECAPVELPATSCRIPIWVTDARAPVNGNGTAQNEGSGSHDSMQRVSGGDLILLWLCRCNAHRRPGDLVCRALTTTPPQGGFMSSQGRQYRVVNSEGDGDVAGVRA
jgi:hypothetical protein